MKKQLILTLCLLLGLISTQAQDKGHYVYVNGGLGLHDLNYDLLNGSEDGSLGYTFELGYDYFFSKKWGIGTGIGIQSFRSTSTISYMSETAMLDEEDAPYFYRVYYDNAKEEQKIMTFDIPIVFSYQTRLNESWKLLATIGGKVSIPVSSTYQKVGGRTTTGYYSQYNVELANLPRHNFTTFDTSPSADFTADPFYSGNVSLGGLYKLNNNFDLYVGAYFNYGFSVAVTEKNQLLYLEDGTYHGVLESDQASNVKPMAVGLKVGLRWHKAKNSSDEIIETILETIPEIVPEKVVEPVVEKVEPIVEDVKEVVEPEPVEEEIKEVIPEPVVVAPVIASLPDIKFEVGTDKEVDNTHLTELELLAESLKANSDLNLRIIGHTCDIGTREVNMRVGLKRANVVKEQLMELGVNASQIVTETKAFDEPLVPNTSEENRAKNRRVEFILE